MNSDEDKYKQEDAVPEEEPAAPLSLLEHLAIHVDDDATIATLHIKLPLPGALLLDDVRKVMEDASIRFGVDMVKLKNNIENFNSDPTHITPYITFEIAKGTPIIPPTDGRIELLVQEDVQIKIDKQGKADFRNIDKFKYIDANTIIARRHPPKWGKNGYNVYGDEIKTNPPKDPKLVCGENIEFNEEKNEYIALTKGVFIRNNLTVSIDTVLNVDGNAGIESGNLVYDNSINIKGNIERGAIVACQANLQVGGYIESHLVRVGKGLKVEKGINAQSQQPIYVGDFLDCTYLDNSYLIVEHGGANIERSINSSKLIVHGDLTMGSNRSAIIGSEIISFGSITTNQIGNSSGNATKVVLGSHDAYEQHIKRGQQQLKDCRKIAVNLAKELNKYKSYTKTKHRVSPDMREKIKKIYVEYQQQNQLIERLETQLKKLNDKRHNLETVRLSIRTQIFPGAEIHYRKYVKKITAPMSSLVIEFSPKETEPRYLSYSRR